MSLSKTQVEATLLMMGYEYYTINPTERDILYIHKDLAYSIRLKSYYIVIHGILIWIRYREFQTIKEFLKVLDGDQTTIHSIYKRIGFPRRQ